MTVQRFYYFMGAQPIIALSRQLRRGSLDLLQRQLFLILPPKIMTIWLRHFHKWLWYGAELEQIVRKRLWQTDVNDNRQNTTETTHHLF